MITPVVDAFKYLTQVWIFICIVAKDLPFFLFSRCLIKFYWLSVVESGPYQVFCDKISVLFFLSHAFTLVYLIYILESFVWMAIRLLNLSFGLDKFCNTVKNKVMFLENLWWNGVVLLSFTKNLIFLNKHQLQWFLIINKFVLYQHTEIIKDNAWKHLLEIFLHFVIYKS